MIGSYTTLEAAAASSVDLFASEAHRSAMYPRRIVGFGLVGSTNPGDAAVQLMVGGQVYGKFYNTTGGASKTPTVENDIVRTNIPVPPGATVQAQIVDVGAGNVLACTIVYEAAQMVRPSFRRGRSSYRGGYRRGR